jgi:hypothetical protein
LKIIFKDNGSWHKDLIIDFSYLDVHVIADTYYFVIDSIYKPNIEEISKVKFVLRKLLAYWVENIRIINIQEDCYLPIDFSDQYTGCFKLHRVDNELLEISYGYSLREGWSVSPFDPKGYAKSINDYKETSKKQVIKEVELLEYIKESMELCK